MAYVGKYTSPMDAMGLVDLKTCNEQNVSFETLALVS